MMTVEPIRDRKSRSQNLTDHREPLEIDLLPNKLGVIPA